jgi:phosphatidylethanolamine/phosphatidyl-N-methylethanolamine N-methyltransferase
MGVETGLFLRQLLRNPRQISAIAPSSPALARAMAEGLGPQSGRVVEFGPGTGRLTAGILATGVLPANLTLFEMNGDFTGHLCARFPGVEVVHAPAQAAVATMAGRPVGHVISGLPLLSMPPALRASIVGAAFAILAPGGSYVQFTYGPKPPLPPDEMAALGLRVEAGRKVWANLPPARVYRFYRA